LYHHDYIEYWNMRLKKEKIKYVYAQLNKITIVFVEFS